MSDYMTLTLEYSTCFAGVSVSLAGFEKANRWAGEAHVAGSSGQPLVLKEAPGAKWTTRQWTKRQTLPQASFQMIPQPWSTALDGSIAEKPGKQHADSRNSKITDVFFQAAKNLLHYFNMLVDKWYRPLEWHKHLYLNKLFHRSVKSELGSHRSMVGN